MYLIVLTGQGDTDVKLVNKATWDYIHSPVPPKIARGGYSAKEKPPGATESIEVTSGSWENDRALQVEGLDFDSVREATAYLRKAKLKLVDEYHGYIY